MRGMIRANQTACAVHNSVGTILSGAFLFGIGFDTATQIYWDKHNQGVRIAGLGRTILTHASALAHGLILTEAVEGHPSKGTCTYSLEHVLTLLSTSRKMMTSRLWRCV